MEFFRKTKGTISIFLVIILVPMMTVSSLFVDASKVNLAKGMAQSTSDLALNTALTNYDTVLKDMYGIFATAQDMDELFDSLESYYKKTITSAGVGDEQADNIVEQIMTQLGIVSESNESDDILNMELIDFSVEKVDGAALNNATLVRKQIVDFMKYRSPINTGLSFLTSLQSFTTLSKQTELVEKRQEYYEVESSVMNTLKNAWEGINNYNSSDIVKNNQYLTNLKNSFDSYEGQFNDITKKIIKDLYETQGYTTFDRRDYSIENVEYTTTDNQKITIPTFYTNAEKKQRLKLYKEYTTYSETKRPTTTNLNNAIKNFNTAYENYNNAYEKIIKINNSISIYDLQYLVQTNKQGYYNNWVNSAESLYNSYSILMHTYEYAEDNLKNTYGKKYSDCIADFQTFFNNFNARINTYNSALQQYANAIGNRTDITDTANKITAINNEIKSYINTLTTAKDNLQNAVNELNTAKTKLSDLNSAKNAWKNLAQSSELKNTSIANQDLAEIQNLSTYLNSGDIDDLISRLQNIINNINNTLTQVNNYKYFSRVITEYTDYKNYVSLLINGGVNMNISVYDNEINQQIADMCNGKYQSGNVNVDWQSQSVLVNDMPEFYAYLYQHFNTGAVSVSTDKKQEDTSNGENLLDTIENKTDEQTQQNASTATSDNQGSSNELKDIANAPSDNIGNNATIEANETISSGDNALSDTRGSLSTMFSSLIDVINNMATDLRDKLYIADYAVSMFSYDTIEKENDEEGGAFSLTRTPINAENNFAYGSEVEYIIYGGANSSNIAKAYASIYAIRLGFNLIYAFMDSSIRDTAFAVATPISAATLGVIPVPLIQGAIIIGMACCESALDLVDLKNGESVPLFKNAQTWKLSVKSIITEASSAIGSALIDYGESAIDSGIEAFNDLLDMTNEELDEYIASGEDTIVDALNTSYDTLIMRHANTAIQKLTTLCNNAIQENMLDPALNMEEYVKTKLDEWLAEEAQGVDTANDLTYIVKKEAVDIIKQSYITPVVELLKSTAESAQNSVADVANSINDKLSIIRIRILNIVTATSQKVIDYKNNMIEEIKASASEGAESLKNKLNEKINGVFGSGGNNTTTDNTAVASLLSFSYSDYLRLFTLIGLYTNEEGTLLRIADAIQANVAKAKGDDDYTLSESAVYVEIETKIQVKPTLLALPLFSDVEGNPSNNQGWYTFENKYIRGY